MERSGSGASTTIRQIENFAADRKVAIEGLLYRGGAHPEADGQVSLTLLDHAGEASTVWMDVPNAMYLLGLLRKVQRDANADVPETPPGTGGV